MARSSRRGLRGGGHRADPGGRPGAGRRGWPGRPGRPEGPRVLNSQAPVRLRREDAPRVTFLAEGSRGWASLCRLVERGAPGGQRGAPLASQDLVAGRPGLVVLLGPDSDMGRALAARRPDRAAAALARWRDCGQAVIEVTDHRPRGAGAGPPDAPAGWGGRGAAVLATPSATPPRLTPQSRSCSTRPGNWPRWASGTWPGATPRPTWPAAQRWPGSPAGPVTPPCRGAAPGDCGAGRRCILDPGRDLGIGGRFIPETTVATPRAAREVPGGTAPPLPGRPGASGPPAPRGTAARSRTGHYLQDRPGLLLPDHHRRHGPDRPRRALLDPSLGGGLLVIFLIGISGINPLGLTC